MELINEIIIEYLTTQLLLDEGITDLRGKYYMKDEGTIQEYVEL